MASCSDSSSRLISSRRPKASAACEHEMDYHRVKIGSGDFLLPEVTTMDALYRNGAETLNETRYSDCREFVGESTIRFDDVDASRQEPRLPKTALPADCPRAQASADCARANHRTEIGRRGR